MIVGFQQEISTEVTLPLLGMRSDGSAFFQYLLHEVNLQKLHGSIPSWVVQKDRLEDGDVIRPNLPLNAEGHFLDEGVVQSSRWDGEEQAQHFELKLNPTDATGIAVFLHLEGGRIYLRGSADAAELLSRLLKDGFLLKRGIAIYLKHLYPFFSRSGEYPTEDYRLLRAEVLDDVRNRALKNAELLEELYNQIHSSADEPFLSLDLEALRSWFEPEIQPELFRLTFGSQTVERYLSAILSLNQKSLLNYNTITLLYSSQL